MDGPGALFPAAASPDPGVAIPLLRADTGTGAPSGYRPRRPEKTVLYQVVQQHLMTMLAQAEARSDHGFGYPAHVKREFERYLACGQFAHGFSRFSCTDCGFERIVPHSCKGRSICPSCTCRRMADTAARLVDHVLPLAPYRLWTLSLPHDIRLLVVRNPDLLSRVLLLFLRTVFAYQRCRARRLGIDNPLTGAVTMIQLFGSILQLTPHAHSWIPDGVFHTSDGESLQFTRLEPPSDDDVKTLLVRIASRVRAAAEEYEDPCPDESSYVMASCQWEASQPPLYTIPLTEDERPYSPRCAYHEGFSLHADLDCHQRERKKLERLLRYGLRPPFAQKRLSLLPDGKVRLELRKPFYTGQTDITFSPVDFLRRLAAAIPRPMQNLIRYHGIFSANAKYRPLLVTLLPSTPGLIMPTIRQKKKPAAPSYRTPWQELLSRVFGHNMNCSRCNGPMQLIQVVDNPMVIDKILTHLGLPTTLPPVAPARGPPEDERDLCFAQTYPETDHDWP